MKKLLLALMLVPSLAKAWQFDGPYFQGLWEGDNWKHPIVSQVALTTFKGHYDGVSTDAALVWHHGDPKNTLLPDALVNAGVYPPSWGLVGGAGYGNGAANVNSGLSVNAAPTLLGFLGKPLSQSSNSAAKAVGGAILGAPQGVSLSLGTVWYANPVVNGTVLPVNHWGSHADWTVGLAYAF